MDNENKELAAEKRREARIKIIKFASVIIGGAIVLACYSFTKVEDSFLQMMLYGLSALMCSFSSILIMGAVAIGNFEKNRHNFFLYDKKKKADIPVSSLTVENIREKLHAFMSIFKRRGKLYVGDLFDDNPNIPDCFKPLFCYEILYELATNDGIDAVAFLGFGSECADIFTRYLRENEDYELANTLLGFVSEFSAENNNSESFKEYLKTKKTHIEEKMLGYTVKNIEKFN